MYNLTEYSNKYSDKSPINDAGNPNNISTDNSTSFKYKSSILEKPVAINNGVLKNVKITVPLKYFSDFWRSLEMPLINCKFHLELNWTKNCVMSDITQYLK